MARLRVGLVLVDPEEIGFDTVQYDQLKIYIPESDLERAWCSVHEASETNPYLGNRRYADIAWEMCDLLSEIASTG